MSIFLTEIGTPHHFLVKQKIFQDKGRLTSNSNKLTGNTHNPVLVREDSEDSEGMSLSRIPTADDHDSDPGADTGHVRDLDEDWSDDKKKLGFRTTYDGFSIWGWVLCLLVERKGGPKKNVLEGNAQALMQEWIASTQQQRDDEV